MVSLVWYNLLTVLRHDGWSPFLLGEIPIDSTVLVVLTVTKYKYKGNIPTLSTAASFIDRPQQIVLWKTKQLVHSNLWASR
jgi:hypothetical protein